MGFVACERFQVDKKLVDVAEVLQHDVKLSDDEIAIFRREELFPLADDVMQGVVVALQQKLKQQIFNKENNFKNFLKITFEYEKYLENAI